MGISGKIGGAFGAVLAVAGMLAARPAEAAVTCPAAKPATVTVTTDLPAPLLDNSLDRRALEAVAARFHPGEHPIGLYTANLQLSHQTQFVFEPVGREVCVVLTQMALTLRFGDRKIYVLRDYPPGTCAHNAVLGHERKHQAVDEGIVQEYLPRLLRRLETALAQAKQTTSVPIGKHEEAMQRLDAIASAAVAQGFQEMQAERNRREAAVDNREEYARVARSCPGGLRGGL